MRLLHPCPGARITQRYGENPGAYAAYGLPYHMGVDFACPVGTPIYAVADGITENGNQGNAGFGAYVCLHMANGWHVYTGHLSRYASIGTRVKAGDVIGWSGNTGNSTGPHMHLEIRPDGTRLGAIDPLPLLEEGGMGSKLSFHVQRPEYPEWLKRHVRESGVQWVKVMDPDAGQPDPFGVRVIGRLYFKGDADKALIVEGAAGADKYYALAAPRMAKAPWVYAWEGPNEPAVDTPMACRNLAAFCKRLGYLLHRDGRRYVALSISTGNPPEDAYWQYLGDGLQMADYLGMHEYGMHTMTLDGWHLLRYRKAVAALKKYGFRVPPIFITETGIDYHGNPNTDGWRVALGGDEAAYMAQLAAYDTELQKDPLVLGACPFTWMPNNWPSFEVGESMSARIVSHIRTLGAFNPWGASAPPIPQPEVPVTNHEDAVRAVAWNALGVPYNPGAAFVKYAKAQGLGRPLGPERGEGRYMVQPFERGIVYAVDADWGNVKHYTW